MKKFIKKIIKMLIYPIIILLSIIIVFEFFTVPFSKYFHGDIISYLSLSKIKAINKTRGLVQDHDSYIYRFHKFEKRNFYPHLIIDENGFRNSVFNQKKVNTVLLGDSIFFARDSKLDIGDLFRKDGKSLINLGMGGYGPNHYLLVYKKFIVDKKIEHKNLIINLFPANDFKNTLEWPYGFELKSKGNKNLPSLFNIIYGLYKTKNNALAYEKKIIESKNVIELPYKTLKINYLWWPDMPKEQAWYKTTNILKQIIFLAREQNVNIKLIVNPSAASVYGKDIYPKFSEYYKTQKKIYKMLKVEFEDKNVVVFDPTDFLSEKVKKKFIYVNQTDTHFNEEGIKTYYDLINIAK